jgi:hypothetical protein
MSVIIGHRLIVRSSLVTQARAMELYAEIEQLIRKFPELDLFCSMAYADGSDELYYKPSQIRPQKTRADLIQEKIAAMKARQEEANRIPPVKLSRKQKKRLKQRT